MINIFQQNTLNAIVLKVTRDLLIMEGIEKSESSLVVNTDLYVYVDTAE